MFFLAIITHPILDAQTTWGTQLFWPFEWRVAVENIFIIDPIYTLPFLTFLILTVLRQQAQVHFLHLGLLSNYHFSL